MWRKINKYVYRSAGTYMVHTRLLGTHKVTSTFYRPIVTIKSINKDLVVINSNGFMTREKCSMRAR